MLGPAYKVATSMPPRGLARILPLRRTPPMARSALRRTARLSSAFLLLLTEAGGCRAAAPRSCGPAVAPLARAAVGWPNAPTGLPPISDEPFNALDENGWRLTLRETRHG